jgi:hypothetical protein
MQSQTLAWIALGGADELGLGWFGNDVVDSVSDAASAARSALQTARDQAAAEIARTGQVPVQVLRQALEAYRLSFNPLVLVKGLPFVDDINQVYDGLVLVGKSLSTGLIHDPIGTLTTFGKAYGPMLAALLIPGAGWAIAGAMLARGFVIGQTTLTEVAKNVLGAAIPEAQPLLAILAQRGEGVREMLVAAALSQIPPETARLVALARNPQSALAEAAMAWLPVNFNGLPVRDLVESARNGTLREDAFSAAFAKLPPDLGAALAVARNPRSAITSAALARLPADLAGPVQLAVGGQWTQAVVSSAIANGGASQSLVATAIALDAAHNRAGQQWDAWRDQASNLTNASEQASAAVRAAQAKLVQMGNAGLSGLGALGWQLPAPPKGPLVMTVVGGRPQWSPVTPVIPDQVVRQGAKISESEDAAQIAAANDAAARVAAQQAADAAARNQAAEAANAAARAAAYAAIAAEQRAKDTAAIAAASAAAAAAAAAENARKARAQAQAELNAALAAQAQANQQLLQHAQNALDAATREDAAMATKIDELTANLTAERNARLAAENAMAVANQARTQAEASAAASQARAQAEAAARAQAETARATAQQAADQAATIRQQAQSAQAAADQLRTQLASATGNTRQLADQVASLQATADQLRADALAANQSAQAAIADLRAKLDDETQARKQAEAARAQAEAAAVAAQEHARVADAAIDQAAAKAAGKGGWLNIYTEGPATARKRAASAP